MRALFVNEVLKYEDEWADQQIDNYLSSQEDMPVQEYIDKVVDYIWDRLKTKLSPEQLTYTHTDRDVIEDLITSMDEPTSFYENVYDYYQDNKGYLDAAEELFDLVFRQITSQGWAM